MRYRLLAAISSALSLVVLNAVILLGSGYAGVAERRIDSPAIAGAIAAARIASRLPPWSGAHAELLGWAQTQDNDFSGAVGSHQAALRWAPADSLSWAEYALTLARAGRFDQTMTLAISRANALAPQSPAVQGTLANLGVSYWTRGTPEQQQLWVQGMRYELAHSRTDFLSHVLTRGRGITFCRGPARLLNEERWCAASAAILLGNCYSPTITGPSACSSN